MELKEQFRSAYMGAGYGLAAIVFFVGLVNVVGFVLSEAGKAMGCAA